MFELKLNTYIKTSSTQGNQRFSNKHITQINVINGIKTRITTIHN